ncbi:TasA family protein [Nocardioides sp.]|uniref:TasA family protein n=1 Tax=Nocardioides sp. TaxID=35761 RepID=UPI002733D78F|nr:TasA family protein [Nocardioides sp.]MDP3890607.1 TasA family protein [Nocardioides sp.]
MSSRHAAPRRAARRTGFRGSARLRALLGVGLVGVLATTGTFAFWTDDVALTGTNFTAGTLDLQVNDTDTSVSTTTLGMAVMVPGNTSAEVLTLKNNGTAPLKWTMTGGLTGADAGAFDTAGSLALTVSAGGTRSGSGNSATCSGGTTLVNAVALTATTTTGLVTTRQPVAAAMAPTDTQTLCFQVTLDAAAPSSLQGKTASATFTVTGTSDVSP